MDKSVSPQRVCVVCLKEISDEAKFCPNCGHNYGGPANLEMGKKVGSIIPVVGGLAILVVGLLNLGNGIIGILNTGAVTDFEGDLGGLYVLGGVVMILTGIIAAIAGGLAMQSRNLVFSLAGGFASLTSVGLSAFGIGLNMFYASQLALIGIILIAISHEEFDRRD
jgi:hypothetical protein